MTETTGTEKYPFVSPGWVRLAETVLTKLIAQHGEEGVNYSVCEAFVDAPAAFADSDGFAAWHFFVEGKKVRVSSGKVDDTDIYIQATWETSLPGARLVYTPELIAERAKNPPKAPDDPNLMIRGDTSSLPSYLGELHNLLAVRTE
jgi:hypothetical protein